MTQLLIDPARRTGCDDIPALTEVLQSAAQRQRSPIDDVLDAGVVDEELYMRELAHDLGIEWLDSIPMAEVPLPLREACGPRLALRHRLLPVEITGEGDQKRLKLATFDPFNLIARQAAAQELALPIDWCMASRKRLHEALRRLYGVGADTFEQILEGRDFDYDAIDSGEDEANVIDQDDDEEASVVKFVNQIIREALDQRATDIHVEPLSTNLRIRYRIDGRLIEVAVPENIKALQSSVIARLKIMARLDIAERRVPQDGRINLQFEGATIDVRVATVPTVEGESVSLRLLNQEKFNIAKLGMEPFVLKKIESILHLPGQCYTPKGCDRCRMTGFSGRLAIYEVILLTQPMQQLVAHKAQDRELRAQAIKDGYIPMRDYGWHKVMKGETTIEEVISVTSSDIGGAE